MQDYRTHQLKKGERERKKKVNSHETSIYDFLYKHHIKAITQKLSKGISFLKMSIDKFEKIYKFHQERLEETQTLVKKQRE